MLDESGRLDVVRVRKNELLVLRRCAGLLAELARPQGTVDERHGHGLALALPERETVSAREARRLGRRAFELVDHLTLGHRDRAERDREADLLGEEFDLDLAEADLAGERMGAAETALGRVAEREQKTLVPAREILQADIAFSGKRQGLARQIADRCIGWARHGPFDEAVGGEEVGDRPHRRSVMGRHRRLGDVGFTGKTLIEQPVGIVERRPEYLSAGQILENGGDAPSHVHARGIERRGRAQARARGAKRAQEKDRFDQVSARLLDGERRELPVVKRALGHHAVDRERELLRYLLERNLRNRTVAAPYVREQRMGVLDRARAALDRHIHRQPRVDATERGSAATASGETRIMSTPRGKSARLAAIRLWKSGGSGRAEKPCTSAMPGPASNKRCPLPNPSTWSTSVAERSGYSGVPSEKPSKAGAWTGSAMNANAACRGSGVTRADMQADPIGDLRGLREWRVEPYRRFIVEHSQGDGGGRRTQRRRSCSGGSQRPDGPRPRQRVHERAERGLAREHRRGESGCRHMLNPRRAPR